MSWQQGYDGQGEIGDHGTPDGVHFGTVRLYRQWLLVPTVKWYRLGDTHLYTDNMFEPVPLTSTVISRSVALAGVSHFYRWEPGWNDALCGQYVSFDLLGDFAQCKPGTHTYDFDLRDHRVPAEDCGCGFWGCWLPHRDNNLDLNCTDVVIGAIEIAGRARIGYLGARAEKARITALYYKPQMRPQWTEDKLRERHPDVPIYSVGSEFLKDFPTTDTTPLLGMNAEDADDTFKHERAGGGVFCQCRPCVRQRRAWPNTMYGHSYNIAPF